MCRNVEMFLATHCAPVLFRRKPAALFAQKHLPKQDLLPLLQARGLHMFLLRQHGKEALTLLYHPVLLANVLALPEVKNVLAQLGYPVNAEWQAQLKFLRSRFLQSTEFPHEIGFFLGYPPEDVTGFMNCNGNCKMCGKWKVYGDIEKATALFEEYEHCRRVLLNHINSGGSISTADWPALTAVAGI